MFMVVVRLAMCHLCSANEVRKPREGSEKETVMHI